MRNNSNGFTLLEALIALAVLTVGVIAMMTLQSVGVSGNTAANRITQEVVVASDRVEGIMNLPYDDLDDDGVSGNSDGDLDNDGDGPTEDVNGDGVDDSGNNFGLDDRECCPNGTDLQGNVVGGCLGVADGCVLANNKDVFWNVATDYPAPGMSTVKVIAINPNGPNLEIVHTKIAAH